MISNQPLSLDATTLIFAASLLTLLSLALVAVLRLQFFRRIAGLNHWVAGSLCMIAASLLHGLKGLGWPFLSILMANGLIILGLLLFASALQLFNAKKSLAPFKIAVTVAAALAAIAWFTYVDESFAVRLIIMTVLQAALYGRLAALALAYGLGQLGYRLIFFAFGFAGAVSLIRLLTFVMGFDAPGQLFEIGVVQFLYLMSFSLSWLLSTLGFSVLAHEKLRADLTFLATYDSLTGALQRGAFFDHAVKALAKAQHDGRPVAALLMDIDLFKQINDKHGHQVGDNALVHFADIVRSQIGEHDLFGRYGGEEFVMLIVDADLKAAQDVAHRIRSALAASALSPSFTVSIGLAIAREAESLDGLLQRADQAMYRGKRKGGDSVEWESCPELLALSRTR